MAPCCCDSASVVRQAEDHGISMLSLCAVAPASCDRASPFVSAVRRAGAAGGPRPVDVRGRGYYRYEHVCVCVCACVSGTHMQRGVDVCCKPHVAGNPLPFVVPIQRSLSQGPGPCLILHRASPYLILPSRLYPCMPVPSLRFVLKYSPA